MFGPPFVILQRFIGSSVCTCNETFCAGGIPYPQRLLACHMSGIHFTAGPTEDVMNSKSSSWACHHL